MIIRPTHSDDLSEVASIIRTSFKDSILPYMVYAQHGAARFLKLVLDFPTIYQDRCLLSVEDEIGLLLGFADFKFLPDGGSFLSYICVAQSARGRGIAKRLIAEFLSANPGLKNIKLDVFSDNGAAISLYDKLGFEHIGDTYWQIRDLPPASDERLKDLKINNLPAAEAAFAQYGFCEIDATLHPIQFRIGRIGPKVLRCFDTDTFLSDERLSLIRSQFQAHEALIIRSNLIDGCRLLNKSKSLILNVNN